MTESKKISTYFGILFLLAIICYTIANTYLTRIFSQSDIVEQVSKSKTSFIISIVMISVFHTILNLSLQIVIYPSLKKFAAFLADAYFYIGVTATILLAVGGFFLIGFIGIPSEDLSNISEVLKSIYNLGFHISMVLWCFAGILFSIILYRAKMVPQWLALWGIVGYAIFTLNNLSEPFIHIDVFEYFAMGIGGVFEIVLSIWLILKGFNFQNHP